MLKEWFQNTHKFEDPAALMEASCMGFGAGYPETMSPAERRNLPRDEKLKIIETLWGDLAADEASFDSPAWHAKELRKTEADLAGGCVEVVEWEAAKQELRKRFE
jgi:putative addiction module component (TIGR02574 family)